MTDIRRWLRAQSLEDYADNFEAELVTPDDLPELSDDDLAALGLPLGPRRRLLKAVRDSAGIERRGSIVEDPAGADPEAPRRVAERRQITVMFCDLVGSTAMSEDLDPEEMRDLMALYQRTATTVIERYAGHIAQYLGDGMMVYFGWPVAHEDAAKSAIHASLELVGALNDIDSSRPLQVRIGIATGAVVVGETGDGDASIPKAAVGETPNIAARLQALAEPEQIIVAPVTRKLAGETFEYEDLGRHALAGISDLMAVSSVVGKSATDGFAAGILTRFVGRETELVMLQERWQRALDAEGQVVVLSGDAGIGKSRIGEELHARLGDDDHLRLRYRCSPYHTNTAYHPIVEHIERAAGFHRDDTSVLKLEKLEALVASGKADVDATVRLLAAMMSLPVERYPALQMSPERQKELTITTLADRIVELAQTTPLLIIFEDVHWIDPTTLDVLSMLIERIQGAGVLLVVTCRPEFVSPWTGYAHVTHHAINRLSRRQGAQLAAGVAGAQALPDAVLDQIIAKTEGVPLFVEELTKNLLEAGLSERNGAGCNPAADSIIPATLQDSLMARLDRLESGKTLAQVGACIGREFSFELLQAVAAEDEGALVEGLQELVRAEIVHERGTPPRALYSFRHALIQDIAHQTLLRTERQKLHQKIAAALQEIYHGIDENEPEVLAFHYSAANAAEAAADYWLKAGKKALQASANLEAAGHLRKGLEIVAQAADIPDSAERELALLAQLGPALLATAGYGARETVECYERAYELTREIEHTPHLFPVLYGCWVYKLTWAEFRNVADMASEYVRLAENRNDTAAKLTGHRMLGFSLSCLGEYESARQNFETVLASYRPDDHAALAYRYGQDPRAAGASMLGWNLWHLGYPDQAIRISGDAVAYARELKHANTRGYVETFGAARIQLFLRDIDGVTSYVDSVTELCEEQKLVFWTGFIKTFKGWTLSAKGQHEDAVEIIREGLDAHEANGTAMFKPHGYALLAQALAGCDRVSESLSVLADALEIAEATDERWIIPELYRLRGESLLLGGSSAEAEAQVCFDLGLAAARARKARGWELRLATSQAKLWIAQNRPDDARILLGAVVDWFTEGFDTRDVGDARALLDKTS